MNLVHVCPDIPDDWKGGITATARLLGISDDNLRDKAKKGRRNGGIDWKPKPNGKRGMIFFGKEIKRFWHSYS